MLTAGNIKFYPAIICGGGPAGIGPLICAIKYDCFDTLLEKGIALVEQSEYIGGGLLTKYNINSNTLAKVLLEAFDNKKSKLLLQPFIDINLLKEVERVKSTYPSCAFMGNFLNQLGYALSIIIKKFPNSNVYKLTKVNYIQLNSDNTWSVFIETKDKKFNKQLVTNTVILSTGGKQVINRVAKIKILPNLDLMEYNDKIILSGDLLSENKIKKLNDLLSDNHNVVIIGGSHSAWSCAWYLLNNYYKKEAFNKGSIKILHRSPIKLFYPSVKEALKDNYNFNAVLDVCHLSGRVNRFSGLRGDSFDLARKVMNHSEHRIQLFNLKENLINKLRQILKDSSVILPAYGYEANVVPIFDTFGKEIELAYDDSGLIVDQNSRIMKKNGEVLNNILAYGLGAGMKPSKQVGGEMNLSGRVDGIWVFQNDVGKIVLTTLFNNLGLR